MGHATATFRFYEELNDFLPPERRKRDIPHPFDTVVSVKHAIEAHGVPHTEVDLVLVNGESVGFDHPLTPGDRVAVYPTFEGLDISPINHLRPEPLRRTSFLVDVHLGTLARLLRLLGFDAARAGYAEDDASIVRRAIAEHRILLTRDRRLLQRRHVTHGRYLHSENPEEQAREVLGRFDLWRAVRAFTRCLACNGALEEVAKEDVIHRLEPETRRHYDRFQCCRVCGRVYWKGSHYRRLADTVERITGRRPE